MCARCFLYNTKFRKKNPLERLLTYSKKLDFDGGKGANRACQETEHLGKMQQAELQKSSCPKPFPHIAMDF